ncbi:MAG TPA: OmpA family protein [Stellaceae bacterium]|nr:OmpA family protein [Stellaceae bacterium]
MTYYRSFVGGVAVCGLGLLLAGCSGWTYSPPTPGNPISEGVNLSAVRAAASQSPATFNQALASDYADYANSLHKDNNYVDVDYFSRKGLAAAKGATVPPEDQSRFLIPLEVPDQFRSQLADGRGRLVTALNGGAGERAPGVAARAQVSYDCWVNSMEDNWQAGANGVCRKQFETAMNQLENPRAAVTQPSADVAMAPSAAREFRVYFDFNQAQLGPDAQQVLQRIAQQAKQDPKLRVVVVGKADRTGSDAYNLALSQRRADAVRQLLVQAGVPEGNIDARWVGEREPPVPTAQGVREPRNRVVEIAQQP